MNIIKVLLVEDDQVWADGISQLLSREPDMTVIHAAATQEEAIHAFPNADIVLMDINLTSNQLDGLELAAEMRRQVKPVKIIMLTAMTDRDTILEAFSAGAVQYVSKTDFLQIVPTIRSIMYAGTALTMLSEDYARLKAEQAMASLTPAERELLPLLEQGLSSKAIALKLHKAHSTVKNQLGSIFKKLNATTRDQVLAKVRQVRFRNSS